MLLVIFHAPELAKLITVIWKNYMVRTQCTAAGNAWLITYLNPKMHYKEVLKNPSMHTMDIVSRQVSSNLMRTSKSINCNVYA